MSDLTSQTLDEIKKVLGAERLEKATNTITTATGLVAYDLQAPAKNLYPVNTPIRNVLPRVPGIGTATNWKAVTAILGGGYDSMGWVPEGQRSAAMTMTEVDKAASFKTIGEEAAATYEAINAGRGFEDIRANMTMRLIQKTMLKEENALMGGNGTVNGVALGTPTAPTCTASGTGGTLPALTYDVIVVALTYEGYKGASLAGGVPTSQVVTGQDGLTYTLKGGSSNKSTTTTQAVTLGQHLFASTPVVTGAVAYAWYIGAAGAAKLEAITTINSLDFSTPLVGTGQAATAVTVDNSQNSLGFSGLLYQAWAAASGAYIKSLATGTAGTGTGLTSSNYGGINEIDDMLVSMWNNYQVSPDVIWMNAQELRNATKKMLSTSGGASLTLINDANGKGVVANSVITGYFSPFNQNGTTEIPIRIHPSLPPGTIFGWANNLPAQYNSPNVPNVAEVVVRQDYYQIDWPIVTRSQQVGVYAEEVLALYYAPAVGIINNIANV